MTDELLHLFEGYDHVECSAITAIKGSWRTLAYLYRLFAHQISFIQLNTYFHCIAYLIRISY